MMKFSWVTTAFIISAICIIENHECALATKKTQMKIEEEFYAKYGDFGARVVPSRLSAFSTVAEAEETGDPETIEKAEEDTADNLAEVCDTVTDRMVIPSRSISKAMLIEKDVHFTKMLSNIQPMKITVIVCPHQNDPVWYIRETADEGNYVDFYLLKDKAGSKMYFDSEMRLKRPLLANNEEATSTSSGSHSAQSTKTSNKMKQPKKTNKTRHMGSY